MGVVMDIWEAEVAVARRSRLGEGPWWDEERCRLLWVDIPAGTIHAFTPTQRLVETVRLNDPVGFIVGRKSGGYVAGTADGLRYLTPELEPGEALGAPDDLDAHRRINDGTCDPAGRVLFGTVDPSGSRTGTLWQMSADGTFTALVRDVTMSNGIAFSPNGRLLYYVDTASHAVDLFDYNPESGTASRRRAFVRIPASVGLPDGLAVDARGCVWLAIWGAGEVWRLAPNGDRLGIVRVAASRTTSCSFGGDRGNALYITTARDGESDTASEGSRRSDGTVFVAQGVGRGGPVWKAAA